MSARSMKSPSSKRVAAFLRSTAASLSNPQKWCQHKSAVGQARDLSLSMYVAADGDTELFVAARRALVEAGCKDLTVFNDSCSHKELLAMLRFAAGRVEQEAAHERRRRVGVVGEVALALLALALVWWGLGGWQ